MRLFRLAPSRLAKPWASREGFRISLLRIANFSSPAFRASSVFPRPPQHDAEVVVATCKSRLEIEDGGVGIGELLPDFER